MDAIRPATELAEFALCVPIVRSVGLVLEGATARWAWNLDEISGAAEAAFHVLPVAVATEASHLALRIPEIAHVDRRIIELAMADRDRIAIIGRRTGIQLASAARDASRSPDAHKAVAFA